VAPDIVPEEETKMESRQIFPAWVALISMLAAVAFGAWTISAEVHNMRYRSLSDIAGANGYAIIELRKVDSDRAVANERFATEIDALGKTLDEVRADVKTLLTAPK